jgi:hypothetical protein
VRQDGEGGKRLPQEPGFPGYLFLSRSSYFLCYLRFFLVQGSYSVLAMHESFMKPHGDGTAAQTLVRGMSLSISSKISTLIFLQQ